ncbi:putative ammonium transporter 2 [Tigriopus californicus]|uniref:putative ammonium transporter 2 n=1 Tax=Tigriopus californicus TaxID=6832 RepID=UPI0027DA670F|nr:putative ammonium transporter 2 [Tigriopus californicus]
MNRHEYTDLNLSRPDIFLDTSLEPHGDTDSFFDYGSDAFPTWGYDYYDNLSSEDSLFWHLLKQAQLARHGETFAPTETTPTPPSVELGLEFENDDAAWVMACTFIIFSMQTGYALIESGMCSMKNEVNIMVKNIVDVALGGFTFWCFGYGLVMGKSEYSTPLYGVGYFFFSPDANQYGTGEAYLRFFFQLAYVSSATTIVSGAMAERCNFRAFMLFCVLNVFIYCFPAHWMWGPSGWLKELGAKDIAGAGVVHALGGSSSLVASWYLGPRTGLYTQRDRMIMGNAQNSLVGLFMLWWAFLAFNSGSTFGVSIFKWNFSAKATVTTMISSFGGGILALTVCYVFYRGKIKVGYVVTCVFSSLVAITGSCYIVAAWEAFVIGFSSASLCFLAIKLAEGTNHDDPVASFAVHGVSGVWGLIAVGIFAQADDRIEAAKYDGLLNGGYYLIGVQCLAALVIVVWSMSTTYLLLWFIDHVIPLRMDLVDELLGADYATHNILHADIGIERAVGVLKEFHDFTQEIEPTGNNLGHSLYLEANYQQKLPALPRGKSAKIFGQIITQADVDKYNQRDHRQPPRRAQSGAFGRRGHSQLLTTWHPFDPIEEHQLERGSNHSSLD